MRTTTTTELMQWTSNRLSHTVIQQTPTQCVHLFQHACARNSFLVWCFSSNQIDFSFSAHSFLFFFFLSNPTRSTAQHFDRVCWFVLRLWAFEFRSQSRIANFQFSNVNFLFASSSISWLIDLHWSILISILKQFLFVCSLRQFSAFNQLLQIVSWLISMSTQKQSMPKVWFF